MSRGAEGTEAVDGTAEAVHGTAEDVDIEAVMAEIDAEVAARRASGELPARAERELQELFRQFGPPAAASGERSEALQAVDAAVFVNPVVPVDSNHSGGALVKRGIRSMTLWYVGYVTQQVSQFGSAVSRCLHQIEDRLGAVERVLATTRPEAAPVVRHPGSHRPDAWWTPLVVDALRPVSGPVLHAAAGDGWLVRLFREEGLQVRGLDPDPPEVDDDLDLRSGKLEDFLRAVPSAGLGAVVLTGVVEALEPVRRDQLLTRLAEVIEPGGALVVHSMTPLWWDSPEAPVAADLLPVRPLRPATWVHLLREAGFSPSPPPAPPDGPDGQPAPDYLVIATREG